jgi:dipeptidyl-peptidase 4
MKKYAWLIYLFTLTAHAAPPPVTLQMLYNTPSIIGTSPENYAWSLDSKQLAFLWDEKGTNIRDVWVYSVATGQKRQWSSNGKDVPSGSLDGGGGVSQVVWLPAGKGLLYILGGKLYAAREGSQPRRIESQHTGISRMSLSPDGKTLGFVGEQGTLWVRGSDADAADARQIVASEAKKGVQSFQWSEDGKTIAFLQSDDAGLREIDISFDFQAEAHRDHLGRQFPGDETTRFRVGVAPLSGGEVRWMERPDLHDPVFNYALSHDGKKLLVSSTDFLVKTHSIYVYETSSGKQQLFYRFTDPKQNRADQQVVWAPHDRGLIMLSDRNGHDQLYSIAAAGAEPKQLTPDTYEIAAFKVDPAGQIFFLSNQSHYAQRQLYRVPLAGGTPQQITRVPGTHAPTFSPDFHYAADHFSSDSTPPDLWLVPLTGKAESTQLTHSPTSEFARYTWATVKYVTFPSKVDGVQLMGRVVLPAGYEAGRKYPLIVGSVYTDTVRNQWGGRNSHPTWGLDQYLAVHGYVQLNVTLRGSWGFGKAFKEQLTAYGSPELDDIESGVQYMIAQGYTEPKRVGIWGSSYGGLLTLMSLFKKPGLYAVGVAGAPASNVAHAYPPQMRVMGEPKGADFPARYEAQSAYYHTQGLRDPLLIIQGTRDSTVLYSDTVALQERLIAQGKTFEIVPVPGSDHKWDDNFNAETWFTYGKLVEFMDRYLMPAGCNGGG